MYGWTHRVAFSFLLAAGSLPGLAQAPTVPSASIDPSLQAKANAGDAAAQVQVGDEISSAAGASGLEARKLVESYKAAAAWYRKAAEQGWVDGELRLAAVYRDGKGVDRDMVQAAAWYRKAAEQGNVSAQATLGVLYSMGQGVVKSDVEAYFWLALAASAKGPNQEKYAANRQMIGTHITADELSDIQDRVAKWQSEHPR